MPISRNLDCDISYTNLSTGTCAEPNDCVYPELFDYAQDKRSRRAQDKLRRSMVQASKTIRLSPRRLLALRTECPTALFLILIAALWSRSRLHPQLGQSCQRICSFFGTFSSQLEQSCEVLWALTVNTNKPAFTALFVRIDSQLDHPASNTDLANIVRASPLMFKSSTAITSYFDSR